MELRTYMVGEVFESSQGETIVVEDISTIDEIEKGCDKCCIRNTEECWFARCTPDRRWDERYVHFELFEV